MMYKVDEKERARIQEGIDCLFNDATANDEVVNFTGSSISPDNIKQVLIDNGFEIDLYDQNSYDNWWYFKHPDLGTAVIDFNAECFALKLYKKDEG